MALFQSNHLKTTVLIEKQDGENFVPAATGFLIGFIQNKSEEENKTTYRVFLATNRHVFEGFDRLWFRFDQKEKGGTVRFPVDLKNQDNSLKWLAHKDARVDLAMITISPQILDEHKVEWAFFNEEIFAYQKNFEELGVSLGDGVFIVGFPMGIAGDLQNYAIVRSGTIARIDEEMIKKECAFLIDAFVFPGNSGGPVLLKPESTGLINTKVVNSIFLLGTIAGYKIYKEAYYTHQTTLPTVASVSMQNSGLAVVVPMDFVKEIYDTFLTERKKLEQPTESKENAIEEKIEASLKDK